MTAGHPDPLAVRLARAIEQALGVSLEIEQADREDWASATFAGATHRLVVVVKGDDAEREADRIAGTIAETQYELRGHIVADIVVASRDRHGDGVLLAIDALTIADA